MPFAKRDGLLHIPAPPATVRVDPRNGHHGVCTEASNAVNHSSNHASEQRQTRQKLRTGSEGETCPGKTLHDEMPGAQSGPLPPGNDPPSAHPLLRAGASLNDWRRIRGGRSQGTLQCRLRTSHHAARSSS